jgi:hypothetical protein
MTEKNYDPDNENCPEKDTVEQLQKLKINSERNKNVQNDEEFKDNSPNLMPEKKNKPELDC